MNATVRMPAVDMLRCLCAFVLVGFSTLVAACDDRPPISACQIDEQRRTAACPCPEDTIPASLPRCNAGRTRCYTFINGCTARGFDQTYPYWGVDEARCDSFHRSVPNSDASVECCHFCGGSMPQKLTLACANFPTRPGEIKIACTYFCNECLPAGFSTHPADRPADGGSRDLDVGSRRDTAANSARDAGAADGGGVRENS